VAMKGVIFEGCDKAACEEFDTCIEIRSLIHTSVRGTGSFRSIITVRSEESASPAKITLLGLP